MRTLPPPLAELAPVPPLRTVSARLTDDSIRQIDTLAAQIGTGRGPVLRALILEALQRITATTEAA